MLIGVLYPIVQVQVCKYAGPYLVITLHEDILIPTDSWPLTGSILTDMSEIFFQVSLHFNDFDSGPADQMSLIKTFSVLCVAHLMTMGIKNPQVTVLHNMYKPITRWASCPDT